MAHLLLETGTDVLLNENGLDGYMLEDGYVSVMDLDAPVAHWRLGESSGTTAFDRAGGRNGTYLNTPTLATTGALAGDTDTAVSFASASQEAVTIPTSPVFNVPNTGQLSIELWVRFSSVTPPPGSSGQRLIGNLSNSTGGYDVYTDGDTGSGLVDVAILAANGVTFAFSAAAVAVSFNAWHHFVFTMDNAATDLFVYVDGLLVQSVTTWTTTVAANTTDPLVFGANATDVTVSNLDGALDEVALYGTVLTASQVLTHYIAGIARRPQDARVNRQAVTRAANF